MIIARISLPRPARRRGNSSRFRGSSALRKKQSLQVSGIPENAGFFHGLGSRGARRHRARLFESCQSLGFQLEPGPRVFLFPSHENLTLCQPVSICLSGARLWNRATLAGQLFHLGERRIDRAGANIAGVLHHAIEPAVDVENGALA
jgi:hypothetical protein